MSLVRIPVQCNFWQDQIHQILVLFEMHDVCLPCFYFLRSFCFIVLYSQTCYLILVLFEVCACTMSVRIPCFYFLRSFCFI